MAVECVAGSHVAPEERFDYFWRQQGEWVEEPNRRRGGESGVQRVMSASGRLLYCKRQTGHIYRSWLHPFGRPTVLRERDALKGLRLLDVRVPEMVFCEARRDPEHQWKAILVTAFLDGFDEIENGMPPAAVSSTVNRCMSVCSRKWRPPWHVCTRGAGSTAVCTSSIFLRA